MAYTDQNAGRPVAIGAVVLVHAAIGVGLLSGLAVKFVKERPTVFVSTNIPYTPPPKPPEPLPPEPQLKQPTPTASPLNAPIPRVQPMVASPVYTTPTVYPPQPADLPIIAVGPPVVPTPPSPPPVSLARGAQVRGDQGGWFPQDGYPAAARRAGAEGRVSVSVEVGANGRVVDCQVVGSSGDDELDAATCRLATRNGRFEPARDGQGNKVAARLNLRPVRWTLER